MFIKEELLSYLTKGYIHIGKKDYLFFNNLKRFIDDGKNITTKQNDLFNKLITKYQRQLKKQNFDVQHLLELNWHTKVVPTDPELLIPKLSLVEDKIIVKAPYNKKFSHALSNTTLLGKAFNWDKNTKTFVGCFSTINFRTVFDKVKSCFPEYKLCNKLQNIVDDLEQYKNKIWTPTLVKSNGVFYIAAINEPLHNQLETVELGTNYKNLYSMINLGIVISDDIGIDQILKKFLNNYEVFLNVDEVDVILKNLNNFGIDKVYLQNNSNNFLKKSTNLILEQLKIHNIKYDLLKTSFDKKMVVPNSIAIKFSKTILTHSNILTDKVIVVANDNPIDIK